MEESRINKYMRQLMTDLGWDEGTIPLAHADNINLENALIAKQDEIQRLKELIILQSQKCTDLTKYKEQVHTEYQENTRLLFANKQQLEQEVKFKQLATTEADRLDRDIIDKNKKISEINTRVDRLQTTIGRLLKNADTLKKEVCGEHGALQEWRASLERSAGDITAIEQFTKQDISKAKAMEVKRQKLKVEHDQMQERLNQLVANLNAEERSCERISIQVMEGMEQRRQMMSMWSSAVQNLRDRDTDIRHIREDYAVLENECNRLTELCREQQSFCDQQRNNNADASRENQALAVKLSNLRLYYRECVQQCLALDSEVQALQRELGNIRGCLEKEHMENRHIIDEIHKRDIAFKGLVLKNEELKEKKKSTQDKSQSSEKRSRELEKMLNDEERYTNQISRNKERAMHCSYVEQQKLLAIKNDEKLFRMHLKASKASISKLETKQKWLEKDIISQRETLYGIFYQVETIGARVAHMEGHQDERMFSAALVEREKRLQDVRARHAARVLLLEKHSVKLEEELRRLGKDVDTIGALRTKLQSRLRYSVLLVEGGEKEVCSSKEIWRRLRVEEALVRLKHAQASRALAGLGNAAFNIDKQRLQLEAAMNERIVEIHARRDMFNIQKRSLAEDCGKLRCEIREREQRIEQLKKRYDIFIASLGKDDSGQALSATFFKIKFAAERAELRERGAALDTDINRAERDVSALEHALKLLHAAHERFVQRILPLQTDAPELEEIRNLMDQYYSSREELEPLRVQCAELERQIMELTQKYDSAVEKNNALAKRESDMVNAVELSRDRLQRQESKLNNARERVRAAAVRAKKCIDSKYEWRLFQIAMWVKEYTWSAHTALTSLAMAVEGYASGRLATLLKDYEIEEKLPKQRAIKNTFLRIITNSQQCYSADKLQDESLLSYSTSSSNTSGFSGADDNAHRLLEFKEELSKKLDEPELTAEMKKSSERAELRERGAALDTDINRAERDVSALEHALKLLHAAHERFVQRILPLQTDAPELEEIRNLMDQYYSSREELEPLRVQCAELERQIMELTQKYDSAVEKNNALAKRESDMVNAVELSRDRLQRQESKLNNARERVRAAAVRAKKCIDSKYEWRLFQIAMWVKEYTWSAHTALTSLAMAVEGYASGRLATLLKDYEIEEKLPKQRAIKNTFLRIITNSQQCYSADKLQDESLLSYSTSSSNTSGFSGADDNAHRLLEFKEELSKKLDEPELTAEMKKSSRKPAYLRVISLGISGSKYSQ